MPNEQLANRILDLGEGATATERLVLKVAAGMIKNIDPDYDADSETDERIKITDLELQGMPGPIEISNGVASPKDWEIPEHIQRSEEIGREIDAIAERDGINRSNAMLRYWQSKGKMLNVLYED